MLTSPRPQSPIATLLQLGVIVGCSVMGFRATSLGVPVAGGAAVLVIAHIIARYFTLVGVWMRDGWRILLLMLYLFLGNAAIAAAIYGVGFLVGIPFR